jgi:hypothetical protein
MRRWRETAELSPSGRDKAQGIAAALLLPIAAGILLIMLGGLLHSGLADAAVVGIVLWVEGLCLAPLSILLALFFLRIFSPGRWALAFLALHMAIAVPGVIAALFLGLWRLDGP